MEIEVAPADLLSLAARLAATADDLDRRRAGVVEAVLAQAPHLGDRAGGAAVTIAAAADDAVGRLVRAHRHLVALLSASGGRYVAADRVAPVTHPNRDAAG